VSSLWIQVVYGAVLLTALAFNSSLAARLGARQAVGAL
jgi:hypothetical protein